MNRQELEAKHGKVWDKTELLAEFEVRGFGYGCVVVERSEDRVLGSMDFQHSPRFYYSFIKDSK